MADGHKNCCHRVPTKYACPRCGARLDAIHHRMTSKHRKSTQTVVRVECSNTDACGVHPKEHSGYGFGLCWEIRCQAQTKKGTRCTRWFTTDDVKLVHCAKHGGETPCSVARAIEKAIGEAVVTLKARGGQFSVDDLDAEARRIAPDVYAAAERLGLAEPLVEVEPNQEPEPGDLEFDPERGVESDLPW